MTRWTFLALVAGAAGFTLLILHFGIRPIGSAIITLGWTGFLATIGLHLGLIMLMGLAWWQLVRRKAFTRPRCFIWGRLIRDAGGEALPFSQLGGFVLGARAATLCGVPGGLARGKHGRRPHCRTGSEAALHAGRSRNPHLGPSGPPSDLADPRRNAAPRRPCGPVPRGSGAWCGADRTSDRSYRGSLVRWTRHPRGGHARDDPRHLRPSGRRRVQPTRAFSHMGAERRRSLAASLVHGCAARAGRGHRHRQPARGDPWVRFRRAQRDRCAGRRVRDAMRPVRGGA